MWHSLSMDEGFIEALQYTNFNSSFSKAHTNADVGGEFVLARFGNLNYVQVFWHYPTADLLDIYKALGHNVTYGRLNICMGLGYLALLGNRIAGSFLFPSFVYKAPFLGESYFTYPHGFDQLMLGG